MRWQRWPVVMRVVLAGQLSRCHERHAPARHHRQPPHPGHSRSPGTCRHSHTPYTWHTLHLSHLSSVTSFKCHTLHLPHLARVSPYTCHTLHRSHLPRVTPYTCHTLYVAPILDTDTCHYITHCTLHRARVISHSHKPSRVGHTRVRWNTHSFFTCHV